jgi:hypothetical protein
MTKVPFAFQNAVRTVYFDLLSRFIEDEGLSLGEDVILDEESFKSPIVAVIDSHSQWGELNDLTNELTSRGLNNRAYDGLKIVIKDNKYKKQIEKIADNMKRQLAEDVAVTSEGENNEKMSNKKIKEF